MEIAHIVPPPWTGFYQSGTYQMALAHWVLKYPHDAARIRSKKVYVMLDNSAFEGEQVSPAELSETAAVIGADEVVLPDVLGDPGQTLQRSWAALGRVNVKRVMFVPQGRTYDEWRKCLKAWLTKWNQSEWSETYSLSLGISSLREATGTKPQVGTREHLLEEAARTRLPIHLLGVGNLKEFALNELPKALSLGVRGVDTSTAFALGAEGFLATPHTKKVFLGDPTKYDHLGTWARRLIALNIRILSEWVNAGKGSDEIPVFWIRQTASKWLKYWAQGFAAPLAVMKACGMPKGKYAYLRWAGKEKYVRPVGKFEKLKKGERIVEVTYV